MCLCFVTVLFINFINEMAKKCCVEKDIKLSHHLEMMTISITLKYLTMFRMNWKISDRWGQIDVDQHVCNNKWHFLNERVISPHMLSEWHFTLSPSGSCSYRNTFFYYYMLTSLHSFVCHSQEESPWELVDICNKNLLP